MDFFKINADTWDVSSDMPDVGTGAKQISWVERFNFPGEFKIIGDPARLMDDLPLGTYFSHSNTDTIMVVENIVVDESEGKTAEMVVSGRTLDACYMDDRVVLYNKTRQVDPTSDIWNFDSRPGFSNYPLQFETAAAYYYSWEFVEQLLRYHLVDTRAPYFETIPNLYTAIHQIRGLYSESETDARRCTKRNSYLSEAVYTELQGSDIGLKVCRPGPERAEIEREFLAWATGDSSIYGDPPPDVETNLFFVVYRGKDLSDTVVFEFNNGDLHSARYYSSIRDQKTAFYAATPQYAYRYVGEATGSKARVGLADADDYYIEGSTNNSEILEVLKERGWMLYSPNHSGNNQIIDAVVSKNTDVKYQVDYNLGDIVYVNGNYGCGGPMKVVEIAIIHDGTTESTIPTLRPVFNTIPPDL